MRILDKLKPQPRWKHADPTVRLEALRELNDPVELATLAETDPDARVRRAAVGLVDDVAVLGRIVGADSDDEARDRAADRLLALAGSPDEGVALAAVEVIGDGRRLATLAKGDAPEAVRAAALAKVTDERALGAIARHAKHASTSQAAMERISSADALVEVALNSDHKDVAMAAFERAVPDGAGAESVALLESIETRTQQKAVARRARTMIQAIEQAAAAARAAEEERRRREAACCEDAERVAEIADVAAARAELARVEAQWTALASSDAAAIERFAAAVTAAQAAIARREAEAEAAAEFARQRAEAIATRDALCQRVETLDGDDVLEQLIPIEEEWRSLMPLIGNGPEADRLDERFALAVAACRKRHEMGAQLAAARETLATLVAEAESLPSLEDHSAALERWHALSREARGLAATLAAASRPATDLAARWAVVEEAFAARAAAAREAELKVHHDVTAQLTRLIERSRRVAEAETITLREGERLMRDIKAGLDSGAKVESTRELEDAMNALRSLQEKVAPRVRELRELDDWRRFANAQRQEQLIAMAEAIVAALKSDMETGKDSDLAGTATALRELHAKWQEVAEAPRHSAQRLWERFRTATDFMRSRCEVYFAKLRDERTTNLKQKAALVEEAEALAQT
ncbi:MAG TPA: DUF349 domain-containing protein, partial [Vicinamibacterales bacterium]|nr:DUF349 domain-containing protein [Vicinamibacterales bacterium]